MQIHESACLGLFLPIGLFMLSTWWILWFTLISENAVSSVRRVRTSDATIGLGTRLLNALSTDIAKRETKMTKKTTTSGNSPAETDDARSQETPQAKKNRDVLANQAEKGLRKAMEPEKKSKD